MIPRDYITEWRANAPWVADWQVEQDLVISRTLVELFSRRVIAEALAFRGGTALYKLHLHPARYSEDIDLVQATAGAVGPVLDEIHATLDGWLGKPQWKQTAGTVTLAYRFDSEDAPPLRLKLKLEINTRAGQGLCRAASARGRSSALGRCRSQPERNSVHCS